MPAFLIRQPLCVFIHNPKTGGNSIRNDFFKGDFDGPSFDGIPHAWMPHFKFAFVRNPFDRLISAWKMFSEGLQNTWWKYPRDGRQGITLSAFLEIVTDESIGYGPDETTFERRIRNHTLPQTHPYYFLQLADFIGRFEQLQQDFDVVCRRLGINDSKLNKTHTSDHTHYRDYFDDATRLVAAEIYKSDLVEFGYEF